MMSVPTPKYPLVDACSTMFNNTLYSYSMDAFQSLSLTEGAEWSQLPMGVPVTGGVCVKTTPSPDGSGAALYVVGGTSNDTTYEGLQRFTFATGQWDMITPTVAVTQNRVNHGAVYLNATNSILVYAGNQDSTNGPSSQTFTIQAYAPYAVLAFESIAPPAVSPILMQWTDSKAMYIGGSTTNMKAMIFDSSASWVDPGISLAAPLYSSSAIKALVVDGDDSSKSLYTFDMTVTPNAVNRTVLVDAQGNPIQNAKPIVMARGLEAEEPQEIRRRDLLTLANWPVYNGTLAPSSTRTQYSIAQDQSGLVVISGGNTDDVLCMFKARDNSWANATATFATPVVEHGVDSPTSTSTVASTASQTASSEGSSQTTAATAAPTASAAPFPVKLLGAVLGSIVAAALILLATVLLLRWRKRRRMFADAGHQRRSSGLPDEKDSSDFMDTGLPAMSSTRQFRGHAPQASQGSYSSMSILLGRVGHKRGGKPGDTGFGSDTSSQFNKKYKNAISNPIPQDRPFKPLAIPTREEKAVSFAAEDRPVAAKPRASRGVRRGGSTRRSSGWNRYWSGGSTVNNMLGLGSKHTTYAGSDRSSDSHYSEHRMPTPSARISATVPPLKIDGQPELNSVASGSPTIAHTSTKYPVSREMSGHISRPESLSSVSSYDDNDRHDAFSSGVPSSIHDHNSWNPIDRPSFPVGLAQSNNYAQYVAKNPRSTAGSFPEDTQFPAPPKTQHPPASQSSDMSWLNLGAGAKI